MTTASLRRAGGSVMVTVPPGYLKANGLSPGSAVRLNVRGNRLTISPVRRARAQNDSSILRVHAEELNAEAKDVLEFQKIS